MSIVPASAVSQPTFQSALFSGGKVTLLRERPAIIPESMADGDGTEILVECAGAFAQAILRTDAATHFGQRIGLM